MNVTWLYKLVYVNTLHRLLQPYDDNFGPEAELKKQIHSSFNSPLALRRNSLNTPFSLSLKAPISMPVAMTTTTQSQSLPGLWKRVEPEPTGLPLHKLLASLESGYPNEVDFAMNMLLLISHQGDIEIDKVCDCTRQGSLVNCNPPAVSHVIMTSL